MQDYLNLKLVRLKALEQWKRDLEAVSFIFPRAGLGHYTRAAIKQPLSPGDVFLLNGDCSANFCSAVGNEFAFWAFSIRVDHLFPLFATSEISLLQTVMDGLKSSRFYPASTRIAQECHSLISNLPPQSNLDHRGQLLRLASLILNEEFKVAHQKRVGFVRTEDQLVQAFESLSTDEMLSLSVSDLAKRFSCSRRHLNRLFHQYFGFSVAALRIEMRLMKAVSLLRDSNAKVINVAEQCGFNHLGLFNTCFRRRFGTSPGQWRKSVVQNSKDKAEKLDHELGCPLRMTGLCPWPENPKSGAQPAAKAGVNRKRPAEPPNGSRAMQKGSESGVEFTVAAAQKAARAIAFQVRAQK